MGLSLNTFTNVSTLLMIVVSSGINNFENILTDMIQNDLYLTGYNGNASVYFLWNCPQMIIHGSYW